MTREEIIRLAEQAGLTGLMETGTWLIEYLERFAALVAAAERERCAKLCEQLQDWPEGATPYDCAAAIRSAE
jgi:hypothetical protein